MMKVFNKFSLFSGLQLNKLKCEVTGIGTLKSLKIALCGMDSINLIADSITILGRNFSYKKQIVKIRNVLIFWRMRNLTVEVIAFEVLVLSKTTHLASVINIPVAMIKESNKIQKEFIWR